MLSFSERFNEFNWPVVIQTSHWVSFGAWGFGGRFKAGEDCRLSEGQIKDGGKNDPKCVVKAYSLAGIISSQGVLHFSS